MTAVLALPLAPRAPFGGDSRPDQPRWQVSALKAAQAVAADPFGHYAAVADDVGNLHVYYQSGEPAMKVTVRGP